VAGGSDGRGSLAGAIVKCVTESMTKHIAPLIPHVFSNRCASSASRARTSGGWSLWRLQ
jgi:hypothetical protein